jgi:predicted nucleic acid-binding protein
MTIVVTPALRSNGCCRKVAPKRRRHPIYDCFYVALAEREHCPLITADKGLIAAAKAIKGVELGLL